MRISFRAAVCVALLLTGANSALADDTGLAQALHDVRVEGGKLCMSGHFHYGSSSGMPNRKAAEADAIKSWANFTQFEYGSDWADYRLAAGRTMSCSPSGSNWSCSLEARPCKKGSAPRKR